MKIAVCLKAVPDTVAQPRPNSAGTDVDGSSLGRLIINPYDEYALTEAVSLKAQFGGDSEITLLSLGPQDAETVLRKGIAIGATHAIHIKTSQNFPALTTAKLLVAHLKNFDLVLCGSKSVDEEQSAVGPALAALLNYPVIDNVHKLEIKDGRIRAHREGLHGSTEVLEAPLPALLTTNKGLNEPRPPKLPDIMKAKRVPIETHECPEEANPLKRIHVEAPSIKRQKEIITDVDNFIRILQKDVHLF